MILLALLLPLVMMAFLFAADALEDLFFPRSEVPETVALASGSDERPHFDGSV
ncbi:hypothetical protein ACIP4T_32360 [Streptomyces massasporeus]|uniref:hypothetical protein n=1 Tax=Streptomyces massasporeus TaxID=67324 RepID=UPI0036EF0AE1